MCEGSDERLLFPHSSSRDAVRAVGKLYEQVDELVHALVMLSNRCTQELEFVMEFKSLEQGFKEVRRGGASER